MAQTESTTVNPPEVVIIGAGWAGLATAVALSRHGAKVTLLESARQVGGRARRIAFNKLRVDNGQHLLIGAYHATLQLMESLKIKVDEKLVREPLSLHMKNLAGDEINLTAPRLPAPLHLLVALFKSQGFSFGERLRAIRFGARLYLHGFKFEQDMSVSELMKQYKQPTSLCEKFWYPLCIATMNTPPEQASAQIFLRVLHDCFKDRPQNSDLLYTRDDLSSLLPDPAIEYVEQQGGSIRFGQRVTGLNINSESGQIESVRIGEQVVEADHVVIATTPNACHNLITGHTPLRYLAKQLGQFSYDPIVTIYLQYPVDVTMSQHMLGMLGSTTQWLFDRRIYQQPGLMAAVISSRGPHMALDNEALVQQVQNEIASIFPDWPAAEDYLVIREKRATFSCVSGINELRPTNQTPVTGLWLAGDYTNTGYPATLEGAVQSGLQCANRIIQTHAGTDLEQH